MLFNAARDLSFSKESHAGRDSVLPCGTPAFAVVIGLKAWVSPLDRLDKFLERMSFVVSRNVGFHDARWLDRAPHPLAFGPEVVPWLALLRLQVTGAHAVSNISIKTWVAKATSRRNLCCAMDAAVMHLALSPSEADPVFAFSVQSVFPQCIDAGAGPVLGGGGMVDKHGAVRLAVELSWGASPSRPFVATHNPGGYEKWASRIHDPKALCVAFIATADAVLKEHFRADVQPEMSKLRLRRLGALIDTHLVRSVASVACRVFSAAFGLSLGTRNAIAGVDGAALVDGVVRRILTTWSPSPLPEMFEDGRLQPVMDAMASAISGPVHGRLCALGKDVVNGAFDGRRVFLEPVWSDQPTAALFQGFFCKATRAVGVPGEAVVSQIRATSVVPFVPRSISPEMEDVCQSVSLASGCALSDVVFVGIPADVVPSHVAAQLSQACHGLYPPSVFVVSPSACVDYTAPFSFVVAGPRNAFDLVFSAIRPATVFAERIAVWPGASVLPRVEEMPLPVAPAFEGLYARVVQEDPWRDVRRDMGVDVCASSLVSMVLSLLGHPRTVSTREQYGQHLAAMVCGALRLVGRVVSHPELGAPFAESHPWASLVELCACFSADVLYGAYNTQATDMDGGQYAVVLVAALFGALCDGTVYDAVMVGVQPVVEAAQAIASWVDVSQDADLALVLRALEEDAHAASEYGRYLSMRLSEAEFVGITRGAQTSLGVVFDGTCVVVTDDIMPLPARVLWVIGHPLVLAALGDDLQRFQLVIRAAACIRSVGQPRESDDGVVPGRSYAPCFSFVERIRKPLADCGFQNTLQAAFRPRSVPMHVPGDDDVGQRKTPPVVVGGGEPGVVETLASASHAKRGVASFDDWFVCTLFEVVEYLTVLAKPSVSVSERSELDLAKDGVYVHAMRLVCVNALVLSPEETSRRVIEREAEHSRRSGSASIKEFYKIFSGVKFEDVLGVPIAPVSTWRAGMQCPVESYVAFPYVAQQYIVQRLADPDKRIFAVDPFVFGGLTTAGVVAASPVVTPYVLDLPFLDSAETLGGVCGVGGLWEEAEVVSSSLLPRSLEEADEMLPRVKRVSLPSTPLTSLGHYAVCVADFVSLCAPPVVPPVDLFFDLVEAGGPSHSMGLSLGVLRCPMADRTPVTTRVDLSCALDLPGAPSDEPSGMSAHIGRPRLASALESLAPVDGMNPLSGRERALWRVRSIEAALPGFEPFSLRLRKNMRLQAFERYRVSGDSFDLTTRFAPEVWMDDVRLEELVSEKGQRSIVTTSYNIQHRIMELRFAKRRREREKQEREREKIRQAKAERDAVPRSALRVQGQVTYEAMRKAAGMSVFVRRTRERRPPRPRSRALNRVGGECTTLTPDAVISSLDNSARISKSMGSLSVHAIKSRFDSIVEECDAEEGRATTTEPVPKKKPFVFDEEVTADNVAEKCEGVVELAGVFMSIRDALLHRRPKLDHAGGIVRAGFVDFLSGDGEERDFRSVSDAAVDHALDALGYATVEVDQDTRSRMVSTRLEPSVPIELANIAHARVASILRMSQPEEIRDEAMERIKKMADVFDARNAARAAEAQEAEGALSYVPRSPEVLLPGSPVQFVPRSPDYPPPRSVPRTGVPRSRAEQVQAAMDNDLIRSLEFAREFGILELDGSHFAPVNPYSCVVCNKSVNVSKMECFCPCRGKCVENVVHLECAVGCDFNNWVTKHSGRTTCGFVIPPLFCKFRLPGQRGIDEVLRDIVYAQLSHRVVRARLWKPSPLEGVKRETPREFARLEAVSYNNWIRHERYPIVRAEVEAELRKREQSHGKTGYPSFGAPPVAVGTRV
jgi:hypothetical protein